MNHPPFPVNRRRRTYFFGIFLCVLISVSFLAARSEEGASADLWYIIRIAGTPVGYLHESLETLSGGPQESFVTNAEMRLVLNRLGTKVELFFASSAEETKAGFLQKIKYEMTASQMTTRTEAAVKEASIEIQSEVGGKRYTRSLSYTGSLLGSEGQKKLCLKLLKEPGDKAEFLTFVPELEVVSRIFRTVISKEKANVQGKDIAALKVEESMEANPIKRTLWVGEDGSLLKGEEPGPFGLTETMLADERQALSAAGGAELPEEMYARSIAPTNIRLPHPRSLDRLILKITHRNPQLGWPEISGTYQRVLNKAAETMILEIKRPYPKVSTSLPVPHTAENSQYLEPNATIQSDAPEVQDLARQVLGEEKDVLKAGLKLKRWVAENMKFDLGIVFAPSSEIFKNRRGTCMGYATMLATLARAAGIPSRVLMGYVYAQGMFGGHAWVEILIGDDWIPLDAAIVSDGPADAGHFYFMRSSLREGPGSLNAGPGQQMFGQIGIQVLEYKVAGGEKIIVPEEAKPYSVQGDEYENPWLGLKLVKPPDFLFSKLDAVWPDPTVVGLEGPHNEKVALRQEDIFPWQNAESSAREALKNLGLGGPERKKKVGGMQTLALGDAAKSGLAVLGKSELWILIVEGKNAPQALNLVVSGLKLKLR